LDWALTNIDTGKSKKKLDDAAAVEARGIKEDVREFNFSPSFLSLNRVLSADLAPCSLMTVRDELAASMSAPLKYFLQRHYQPKHSLDNRIQTSCFRLLASRTATKTTKF
jgi:hypothetical protein